MINQKASTAGSEGTSSATGGDKKQQQAGQAATDAVTLLKADHRKVEGLFSSCEKAQSSEDKAKIAKQICNELIVHTMLEEEIFYPACREAGVEHDMLDEAQVEHDGAKILIRDLMDESPEDEFYGAKLTVLKEYIRHHVAEEEKARDGIFAAAKKAGMDMAALGQRIQTRKQELTESAESDSLSPPQPKSIKGMSAQNQEYRSMNRQSNYRDRDEQGRFASDDDDRDYRRSGGGGGGRSSRSQSRYEESDDYGSRGRSQSNYRERDEEGRFMSDDEGRGGQRGRGHSSYEDDERRGSSSRGSGEGRGWYGDSEGHSRAAERGWEERGGGSSRSRYSEDDEGGRSSSRSRSQDDDDRGRGHGGWFGDLEGHSRAAERGWEERGGYRSRSSDDDDDRRGSSRSSSSSRSRSDDDDDRGRGGWFGDPRGHSQAARRGWRNRD